MADEEKTEQHLEPEEPQVVAGTLEDVAIEEEMSRDYIDYSMSVIIGRALPDVRDGLKPVHRRSLFGMHRLNLGSGVKHKKSANVVGEVMGKYHPHGDSSIYDTIVRMAQDFSMRMPLVDGHGNFGSVDGDPPAAMRYTEVRMQKAAEVMLEDLDKDTVDMVPNYDETLTEPSVLPAKLPNLLLNGSAGIAVGMATNIPPHNLGELCDGITHYIDHRDCTIDDLMQFVKGPDFPTGAQICGRNGIIAMYKLGRGQLCVRGHAEIEEWKNDRMRIVITSLPYQVNKAEMIKHAAELVKDKVIEGISDIRDESKADVRIVVELNQCDFLDGDSVRVHYTLTNPYPVNFDLASTEFPVSIKVVYKTKEGYKKYECPITERPSLYPNGWLKGTASFPLLHNTPMVFTLYNGVCETVNSKPHILAP